MTLSWYPEFGGRGGGAPWRDNGKKLLCSDLPLALSLAFVALWFCQSVELWPLSKWVKVELKWPGLFALVLTKLGQATGSQRRADGDAMAGSAPQSRCELATHWFEHCTTLPIRNHLTKYGKKFCFGRKDLGAAWIGICSHSREIWPWYYLATLQPEQSAIVLDWNQTLPNISGLYSVYTLCLWKANS